MGVEYNRDDAGSERVRMMIVSPDGDPKAKEDEFGMK